MMISQRKQQATLDCTGRCTHKWDRRCGLFNALLNETVDDGADLGSS